MRGPIAFLATAGLLACAAPALADSADFDPRAMRELAPYLQCVPYARERSGVQIFGDAHTWWRQAEGRYRRGNVPKPGAVMAFPASGSMRLGHVAAVSQVIDSRTVLLDHANWSPIGGRRGQIERNVKAVDVSEANDWSLVRVWYDPLQDLGTTAWPVAGFIYNERADGRTVLARAGSETSQQATSRAPSRAFMSAFASLAEPSQSLPRNAPGRTELPPPQAEPEAAEQRPQAPRKVEPRRPAVRAVGYKQPAPAAKDPVSRAIALYDR